ncbi:glycosyltransferase family 2 protein [Thioalkalivibrio sp.]|uniref:glycosyltransferase family 2 protein n=1 Tax=Thioalkalivibrio sp. TaxID=2093813 RepID=UPI003976A330
MQLSVIMSTYNSPGWLEKVLWGYNAQTHRDFEIVIADDGSGPETAALIERMRTETGLRLKHVWQRDDGFRKCRILNKAVLHAAGDYLAFTDGDCIPRQDFLAVHAARAQPGYFLSGGYYKLSMATSEAIGREDVLSGRCFSLDWLLARGLRRSYKNLKLTASPAQARVFNRITPTRCNFKGSNGSAWKQDVLAVNGFDERMSWGGEDREFGLRLLNSGIKARHVRYDAIVLHLDHARGYVDPVTVAANKTLRKATKRLGVTRTPQGIQQLLDSGYAAG